jgi:hypothetical protein
LFSIGHALLSDIRESIVLGHFDLAVLLKRVDDYRVGSLDVDD